MAPQHYKWPLTAALTAGFVGGRILWFFTGGNETRLNEFVPLFCPLLHFFDIRCPTCGLGRSTFLAFNGQLAAALDYHFLGPLILILLCLATALAWTSPTLLKTIWTKVRTLISRPLVFWSLLTSYCLYGFLRV